MGLSTTLIVLVILVALLGACLWQDRKPMVPGRVRLFPYRIVMLLLVVASFTTLAHAISLATGKPVLPRTSKYGNNR